MQTLGGQGPFKNFVELADQKGFVLCLGKMSKGVGFGAQPKDLEICYTISWTTLGNGPEKIQNVNFFQRGGGGVDPKLTFLKSLYIVKRGFKLNFFNTRMCFGKF